MANGDEFQVGGAQGELEQNQLPGVGNAELFQDRGIKNVRIDEMANAAAAAGLSPPLAKAIGAVKAPPGLPQAPTRSPGIVGAPRSTPSGAPGASINKLSALLNNGGGGARPVPHRQARGLAGCQTHLRR